MEAGGIGILPIKILKIGNHILYSQRTDSKTDSNVKTTLESILI